MAKFTLDETIAVASIQQLVNDWAFDLDQHNGLNIGALITDDCEYAVGPTIVKGRSAVEKNYVDRLARLSSSPEGVPTLRHLISNLRVQFLEPHKVSITFSLAFFTTAGRGAVEHADVGAVADVRMNCTRSADGDWRISKFDSNQTFRRAPS